MVLFHVFSYLSCLKSTKDSFFGGLKLKVYNHVKTTKVEDPPPPSPPSKEPLLDMMKFELL